MGPNRNHRCQNKKAGENHSWKTRKPNKGREQREAKKTKAGEENAIFKDGERGQEPRNATSDARKGKKTDSPLEHRPAHTLTLAQQH